MKNNIDNLILIISILIALILFSLIFGCLKYNNEGFQNLATKNKKVSSNIDSLVKDLSKGLIEGYTDNKLLEMIKKKSEHFTEEDKNLLFTKTLDEIKKLVKN
jgi:hypothetical protein